MFTWDSRDATVPRALGGQYHLAGCPSVVSSLSYSEPPSQTANGTRVSSGISLRSVGLTACGVLRKQSWAQAEKRF